MSARRGRRGAGRGARDAGPLDVVVGPGMEQTEAVLRRALAAEGFRVVTEIDLDVLVRDELAVDLPPLRILGACNPAHALRALRIDPAASLVLPCNVVLEAVEGGGRACGSPTPGT